MKIQRFTCFCARNVTLAFFLTTTFSAFSATEIASQLSPSNRVSNVGGSSAYDPIVTPDGRFVLFTSVANNLVVGPGGLAMQKAFPAHLNIFMRDRQSGTTVLVSVNTVGSGGGNNDSLPCAVSSNGQFVVFQSAASDLVAGDANGVNDVFIRDTVNNTTKIVSVGMDGSPGNNVSRDASMTPDGRYVAFVSAASNLVASVPSGLSDIFVRDLQLGTTTLASPGASSYPGQSSVTLTIGSSSEAPILSADGRYVVFYSTAVGLVQNATSSGEIYLRDLTQSTTAWVSAQAHSINTNSVSINYAISTNGQYIAYQTAGGDPPGMAFRYNVGSGATDIIATNGAIVTSLDPEARKIDISADGRFVGYTLTNKAGGTSIQLWDAQSGTSTQVSGAGATNSAICDMPRLDQTGRYVAFNSDDSTLTTNSDGQFHLYVRDTFDNSVQLADVISGGTNVISTVTTPFHLSADGSVAAFDCMDGSISVAPYKYDVFARILNTNVTELISMAAATLPSLTPLGDNEFTTTSVSSNGQFVAFTSEAAGIDGIVTNGEPTVYLHDFSNGGNTLVSANTNITGPSRYGGSGFSGEPSISTDGRYVVFSSSASDLVPNDTNNFEDIFMRDMQTGTCVLVSKDLSGAGEGNGSSYSPQISTDGRYVLFFSSANNLVAQKAVGSVAYWRDLEAGMTYLIGTNTVTMTPDGSNVLFSALSAPLGTQTQLKLWNAQSHTATVIATVSSAIHEAAISADGQWAAFTIAGSGSQPQRTVYAADLITGSNWVVGSGRATSQTTLRISGNGRFLANVITNSTGTNQMYLYDFDTGTNTLVSQGIDNFGGGNDNSDSPALNRDGSLLAYRSAATNLVVNDNNGEPDIFLYSRSTGQTTLVSASVYGAFSGNSRSMMPAFCADGSMLFFESWASDLAAGDFNESMDVFAVTLSTNGGASTGSTNAGPVLTVGIPIELRNGQFSTNNPLTLTWASSADAVYQVEFKNELTDTNWQPLNGTITVVSNQASIIDNTPSANQRFYRLLTH
ncbi:MAG TPA: hypothetical protein VGO67_22160 [Verrucomicrobiae bacterium]|jgi:Tol biopolymer transport system component